MLKLVGNRSQKQGMTPGSVIYTGEQKVETLSINLIQYDKTNLQQGNELQPEQLGSHWNPAMVNWFNSIGLHDTKGIEDIGKIFKLHPLSLEDIVSTHQRPKVEFYDDYIFIVLRMLSVSGHEEIHNEQVSMVLGRDFVLTFQERPGDVFDPLRERIKASKGRIRTLGSDHLAYALVDIIIDSYFVILERYGEDIEKLEEAIAANPGPQDLEKINTLKREMLFLRKSVWPLREMVSSLIREESPLISSSVLTYLHDVYDHCVQIIDTVEVLREVLSGLHDFYLSSLSHKMNEVMKVLTIVGTIFIPLSFFAGVYGMNFVHMPELAWPWAYAVFWLFILSAAGSMLFYFRRRKWL